MYMPTNTHILAPEFDYERPATLEQALALLDGNRGKARPLAGGTDLIVQMKMERRLPSLVVSLADIAELKGVKSHGGLTIGALTSIHQIASSAALRTAFLALREACHAFSTTQIMYMGTIGGNLCNASPAADTPPALLVFDAAVRLVSSAGSRTVALTEFFTGPGKTVLADGEVLHSIEVPEPESGSGSAFLKISRVAADISKVCAAVSVVRDGDRIRDCRIALGAVAPVPLRVVNAERSLAGAVGVAASFERAAEIAAREIQPISDVRASESYRRHATRIIVRDALATAWRRAAKGAAK